MIVYNTTFHIHKDVIDECLEFLRSYYIPKAAESGHLHNPALRRILNSENEEGESFSVQFTTNDIPTLNDWAQKVGGELQQEIVKRFKEKVIGFSTLLEDIELAR